MKIKKCNYSTTVATILLYISEMTIYFCYNLLSYRRCILMQFIMMEQKKISSFMKILNCIKMKMQLSYNFTYNFIVYLQDNEIFL